MGAALLVCRMGLAVVFVAAGASKLLDRGGTRSAAVDFGVSQRIAGPVAALLPVAEIAVGVALVPSFSARFGALGAALLLAAFTVAMVRSLARGQAPDCHCFGQVHSRPVGWGTVARNVALLGVAAFVAVAGWDNPGISATGWVATANAGWVVASAAGAVILALIGFQVWFSLQLLQQNGRTLARLDAVEAALRSVSAGVGVQGDRTEPSGRALTNLPGAGLPLGTPAPDFELETVDGRHASLSTLLAGGRPLVLVFTSAGCGPCESLLPRLGAWQRDQRDRIQIAVVASGDRKRHERSAAASGLDHVLVQTEREVAEAYGAYGTPMAVVVDPDGLIASPLVASGGAIAELVALTSGSHPEIRQVPAANGNGQSNGGRVGAGGLAIGSEAPSLVLEDLDGRNVRLADLYGDRTVVLFWNPGCGFCQRMLDRLHFFEQSSHLQTSPLVVVSAGEREQIREQAIRSPVLLDPESDAMQLFGAGGTPMAVLVKSGRIASGVVAGADPVVALLEGDADPQDTHAAGSSVRRIGS
ncbi:MAG TPA: MauE/DoxX family redox-associated membrane protein [Solirubrobacteraceae bacterium]|nr:MauE/DoxX family redox-associated membrane protein [Solirubrobacteraceae bacterium]